MGHWILMTYVTKNHYWLNDIVWVKEHRSVLCIVITNEIES